MSKVGAIEEAAQTLAAGKQDVVIAGARSTLQRMVHAVETMLGREVDLIKRTSRSTATERLSFVIGDVHLGGAPGMSPHEEAAALARISGEAADVLKHLKSKGLTTEGVSLGSGKPGVVRTAIDVVLDEKALGYVSGQKAAAEAMKGRSRTGTSLPSL
jgi:3-oxoacyl-(acyl-carrier-protein) synthase